MVTCEKRISVLMVEQLATSARNVAEAGGPADYYKKFEEDYRLTRGPEGIYMQPHDKPGFGWDPA